MPSLRPFISFHRDDTALAEQLRKALSDAGARPFLASNLADGIDAGTGFFAEITDALRTCDGVICLATPPALLSPWTTFEVGGFFARDKRVMVLLLGGATVRELPPPLSHIQAISPADKADDELARLVADSCGMTPEHLWNTEAKKAGVAQFFRQARNYVASGAFRGQFGEARRAVLDRAASAEVLAEEYLDAALARFGSLRAQVEAGAMPLARALEEATPVEVEAVALLVLALRQLEASVAHKLVIRLFAGLLAQSRPNVTQSNPVIRHLVLPRWLVRECFLMLIAECWRSGNARWIPALVTLQIPVREHFIPNRYQTSIPQLYVYFPPAANGGLDIRATLEARATANRLGGLTLEDLRNAELLIFFGEVRRAGGANPLWHPHLAPAQDSVPPAIAGLRNERGVNGFALALGVSLAEVREVYAAGTRAAFTLFNETPWAMEAGAEWPSSEEVAIAR